jgi:predicted phage-related endonuclease
MTIDEKAIPWIISALALLVSFAGYLYMRKRNIKLDARQAAIDAKQAEAAAKKDVGAEIGMQLDLAYIKRGVDDIRVDQQRMREDMGQMSERITRCEESCKSAHKRLDGLEK